MNTKHKIIAFSIVTALLILVVAVTSIWAFEQMEQAAEARDHNREVILGATSLMSAIKDAETGQRGYLLTGDEAFLEHYFAVRDKLGNNLEKLRISTLTTVSHQNIVALSPLMKAKMADMSRVIELYRNHDTVNALTLVSSAHGEQLMDSIRTEMDRFMQAEESTLFKLEADFQMKMRHLFNLIIAASVLWSLFAIAFIYLIFRQSQQKLRELVHLRTQHLLENQEDINVQLQQVNDVLGDTQERLLVTLNSIGDAVIATDAQARVTLLNPLAQTLTGWTQAEAVGRPVHEILHIFDQDTRLPISIPISVALATGTIQKMTNHTVLIARGGSECIIADSCAPIRDRDNHVVGAILVFRDVTKEYAAKAVLRDNAARILAILNTVADGIVTFNAQNGMIETINHAVANMFGYRDEELIGKNLSVLIPELDQSKRDGSLEDYRANKESIASNHGREVIGWHKDNTLFPIELALSEMWLGGQRYFTVTLRDITIRKQSEAAQDLLRKRTKLALDAGRLGEWSWDAKTNLITYSEIAAQMFGIPAKKAISREQMRAFLSPEVAETARKAWDKALIEHTSYINEYEVNSRLGSPRCIAITGIGNYANDGSVIGMNGVMQDITERKQAEETLYINNLELKKAKSTAEKANLAKSDFLSSMSHELRTPLGAILGFAQLLESSTPTPSPSQKKSVDQILKAGWYLLDLINEILDLALIESDHLTLSIEPVSLIEIMRECGDLIEPQAQKRGISVSFLEQEIPYFVRADHTRLKQIMINLLSNAIKYNKLGGTVAVDYSPTGTNMVRISVSDTGDGLAPELIEQLFQPFNRLGQNAKSEVGTGIGLVVCKRLVELMDGRIGVDSAVGKGSVFWIELNLMIETAQTDRTQTQTQTQTQTEDESRLNTLLYVEDNPANLMLVEDIIARRQNIRLLSAKDGKQGIKLARAMLPDIILMDINLPGINGIDAMKILARDSTTAHIPVIALSANAVPHDIEKALQVGFFRYLTKPINVNELLNTLDVSLKYAKKQAAAAAKKVKP